MFTVSLGELEVEVSFCGREEERLQVWFLTVAEVDGRGSYSAV